MDRETFNKAITYLEGFYEPLDNKKINGYFNHLNDISREDFSNGVKRLIQEYKYKTFPSVADLRYYSGKSLESISMEAISKLKAISRRKSDVHSVRFSDKTLNAVAERYAKWTEIANWTDEKWGFEFKKMQDLYISFKLNDIEEDHIKGHYEHLGKSYRMLEVHERGMNMRLTKDIKPKEIEYDDIGRVTEGIE